MKNNKIYLLLIAIAFLSFSCDEDNSTTNNEIYLSEYIPSDFMFQDDIHYVYQTFYDDYADTNNNKLASWALRTSIQDKYNYDNKNCFELSTIEFDVMYRNFILNDDRYLYNIGLRIVNNENVRSLPHDTNSYSYYDTLIDFSKNKWTVTDVNFINELEDNLKVNHQVYATGEYLGTKDIYIKNEKYKSVGILIKSNHEKYYIRPDSTYLGSKFVREEEMYFVKGIGFVHGLSEESYTFGLNSEVKMGKGKYEIRLVNHHKGSF